MAAGERLLRSLGPRFEEIEAELDALSELRAKPAGTIRITAGEHAAVVTVYLKNGRRDVQTDRLAYGRLSSSGSLRCNHSMAPRCRRVGAVHSIQKYPFRTRSGDVSITPKSCRHCCGATVRHVN
jgi:hypothetical protein